MDDQHVERVARAIYMTHWKPADPWSGRAGSPVWEQASEQVRDWVREQAREALRA